MTPVEEKPKGYTYVKAKCLKRYYTQFKEGVVYDLILNKPSFGGEVIVIKPLELKYANLKAFAKDWQIER